MAVSRRRFVGGIAAALGYLGVGPDADLFAQPGRPGAAGPGGRGPRPLVDLAKVAKINNNENPYGVPPAVRAAMDDPKAWEWANRYGAPDGGLNQAIQDLHGVKAENVILGCGSGELLSSITIALLIGDPKKKVLGVNPTYGDPYSKATQIGRESIKVPLNKDYTQNIPAIIEVANTGPGTLPTYRRTGSMGLEAGLKKWYHVASGSPNGAPFAGLMYAEVAPRVARAIMA